jgi:nucleoside-diphosphate-sugar epimerase
MGTADAAGDPVTELPLAGTTVGVTGASGFCGGWVALGAAAAGAQVVCLGRRPGPTGRHRPWDAASGRPDLSGVDLVVHLAAAVGDPRAGRATERCFHAVNVDGAARLLDAAGSRPTVWVSSASVYDPRIDRLARQAGAVVLRPHAVYGPGDRHLLPRLRRAAHGGVVLLPGPDVRVSATAVQNLADACLQGLRWPAGAVNIADAEAQSRDAMVTAVLAAAGKPARVRHLPVGLVRGAAAWAGRLPIRDPLLTAYSVDQLTHDVVLDTTKARALGWRPERAFADYLATLRAR